MFWIVFGTVFFILVIGTIIYVAFKDRDYEKKGVAETMSPEVWDDIAAEREAALDRTKKFKEALQKAGTKNN